MHHPTEGCKFFGASVLPRRPKFYARCPFRRISTLGSSLFVDFKELRNFYMTFFHAVFADVKESYEISFTVKNYDSEKNVI